MKTSNGPGIVRSRRKWIFGLFILLLGHSIGRVSLAVESTEKVLSPSDGLADFSVLRPSLPHGALQMVGLRSNSLATGKNWVAQFEGKTIESIPSASDPHLVEFWFAIPYGHAPGKVSLTVSSGQSSLEVPFEVTSGDYLQEEIQVSGKHVHPSSSDLKRIQKESKQLGKVYRNSVARKLWSGTFVMPVENGVFTSPFGTQRVFNGSRQSFHQGVDLKAPTGTSILAPEGGRVVLAKDLFYTGNTVILDHGLGLFTVYAHLSELKVSVGQNVKVGTLLGLSGATGRASGPHLHWGALWRRVKFNPVDLTQVLR